MRVPAFSELGAEFGVGGDTRLLHFQI